MMEINELLQKINKADYEGLEKVIISVSDLIVLRRAVIDMQKRIDGLESKLEYTEKKYNTLVSKHLKSYKELTEI